MLISALLLFGPWVLAAVWAVRDPGAASGVVPSEYRSVTEPRERGTDLGLNTDEQAAFSSEIFTNNIRVTIVAFAGGIAAGIGTAALLVYQGVLFGAITGLSIWAGNGRSFFELVTAHGVLELSCVVVASAAGLRMGWALVSPGHRRRGVALAAEARVAVEIVLGTAPWLVLAGLVEGFITPAGSASAPSSSSARPSAPSTGRSSSGVGESPLMIRIWRTLSVLQIRISGYSRARAFALRYAPTHAVGSRSGRASTTSAPARRSWAATRARASSTSSATAAA